MIDAAVITKIGENFSRIHKSLAFISDLKDVEAKEYFLKNKDVSLRTNARICFIVEILNYESVMGTEEIAVCRNILEDVFFNIGTNGLERFRENKRRFFDRVFSGRK